MQFCLQILGTLFKFKLYKWNGIIYHSWFCAAAAAASFALSSASAWALASYSFRHLSSLNLKAFSFKFLVTSRYKPNTIHKLYWCDWSSGSCWPYQAGMNGSWWWHRCWRTPMSSIAEVGWVLGFLHTFPTYSPGGWCTTNSPWWGRFHQKVRSLY